MVWLKLTKREDILRKSSERDHAASLWFYTTKISAGISGSLVCIRPARSESLSSKERDKNSEQLIHVCDKSIFVRGSWIKALFQRKPLSNVVSFPFFLLFCFPVALHIASSLHSPLALVSSFLKAEIIFVQRL